MVEYLYVMGKAKMQRVFGNERGQGLTEYAAILAVVVVIAVAISSTSDGSFGKKIEELYNTLAGKVSGLANTTGSGS